MALRGCENGHLSSDEVVVCPARRCSQKEAAKEVAEPADASEEADYETVDKLEVRTAAMT